MSRYPGIGLLLFCTVSCIEPFQPEINETQDLLVINGSITDQPGWHFVEVSRSSPYNEPDFIPVNGCVVRVEDETGQGVIYSEYRPGVYRADLDESFLGVNKAYKLYVYTQEGEEYQSDYDSLLACPQVDSLYYAIESQETDNPDITYYGLQFYVDVKGKKGESRNFLWKLEESYEYHAPYFIQYYWNEDSLQEFDPPIDTLSICYRTQSIPELYTASTRYLVGNKLNKYPLNYVSGRTLKLKIKYGLMVSQHSLSNDAFIYWEKINSLMTETGGLYEKQPAGSEGNIFNINDQEEQVLGYFYASQEQEKWTIVRDTFYFHFYDYSCAIDTVVNFDDMGGSFYLISLDQEDEVGPPYGYANRFCFDCRERGGSLEPPDYWNEDE